MWLLLAALGLVDQDDPRLLRAMCRGGHHKWGLWSHDVTPVPLYKYTMEDGSQQVGVQYQAIAGPSYRRCEWCPAMERRCSL